MFRLCHLLGLSINFAIIPAGKVLVTVASRGALVAEVPRREVHYDKQQQMNGHDYELQGHFSKGAIYRMMK